MNLENPDNLPVANRSVGDVHYAERLGICAKCSTLKRPVPKMTINGVKVCPDCDTKTNTRSGLVNKMKDPGESAFERIVHKDKNGKEYIEMVPKNKAYFKAHAEGKTIKVDPVQNPNQKVAHTPTSPTQGLPSISVRSSSVVLNELIQIIEDLNVKTMPQFKSRDKVIKTLKKIQGQVDNLTGGRDE